MKTIYSLPEYKFLDSVIKKNVSQNYELVYLYNSVFHNIQLVAASKYRGFNLAESAFDVDKKTPMYEISIGNFVSHIELENIHPNISIYLKGIDIGSDFGKTSGILLYIYQNPLFKYDIEFFKMLFKRATTYSSKFHRSSSTPSFYRVFNLSIKVPGFHAIQEDEYSFEKLMICNDLAIAS